MAEMTMIAAINSALDVMMARDDTVTVMGEDVGFFGGVFRATAGLQSDRLLSPKYQLLGNSSLTFPEMFLAFSF